MRSTPLLTEAEPLEAYSVRLRFEGGTTGEVDLSYLLEYGGVFQPLRDPDYFGQLRADSERARSSGPTGPISRRRPVYAHAQGWTAATA